MITEEAYNTIINVLTSHSGVKILSKLYDADTFGNFIIAFTYHEKDRSIICDRGQIFICNDLLGRKDCKTIISSLSEVSKEIVISALVDMQS